MTPTPATMTVNWIANFAGSHRVCWRLGPSGPYDCSTVVVCAGGGNPCQAVIPIMVENNACAPSTFEGYVQATCEPLASLSGRTPFAVVFNPVPACNKYDVTCANVSVAGFTITDPGSGYLVGSNPAVTISGGGGSGALADCVVGDGGVKTWTITNGGAGYNGGGSATFLNVPAVPLVGIGSGAFFDVTVTAGVVTGLVLVTPGVDFVVTDTFEFNNVDLGGTGAGVIITVDSLNTGEIESVTLLNPGSAYTSVPVGTVDNPPALGTLATVTVLLADCTGFDFGLDCDGNAIGVVADEPLGFVYKKCSAVAPTPGSEWTVALNGCCYDCINATFSGNSTNVNISYTDCTTGELVTVLLVSGIPQTICVVNNSWYWDPAITVLVATAPCP